MHVIIDANILFFALIKNSKTREILLKSDFVFLFPSFLFEEMFKYKDLLLKKSGMSYDDFNKLLNILLQRITVVSDAMLIKKRDYALTIARDIDINDVLYFACALAYPKSIIWSNDKKLKRQSIIDVLNTKEILGLDKSLL